MWIQPPACLSPPAGPSRPELLAPSAPLNYSEDTGVSTVQLFVPLTSDRGTPPGAQGVKPGDGFKNDNTSTNTVKVIQTAEYFF